ncbi:hypothetical protein F4779DRAFT_607540 [Xylariaceae sp. FL0662B]|nr:hypothetical protein F4779DRAFT_607540 [Xylariaceae sp. FL0662B]
MRHVESSYFHRSGYCSFSLGRQLFNVLFFTVFSTTVSASTRHTFADTFRLSNQPIPVPSSLPWPQALRSIYRCRRHRLVVFILLGSY